MQDPPTPNEKASKPTMSERPDDDDDDDTLLVNFNDALIYRRDLRILQRRTEWLNSDLIHFWLRYLQQDTTNSSSCSSTNEGPSPSPDHYLHQDLEFDHVLLMDPSVTSFLVHQCNDVDEMKEFCRTFHAKDDLRWIYLPINDAMVAGNADWCKSTGNHWSLLRIIRLPAAALGLAEDIDIDYPNLVLAEHYNSMNGTNETAARSVYNKMKKILSGVQVQQQPKRRQIRFVLQVQTIQGVPQQSNGYDCGLHVLWMIEQLLQQHQRRRHDDGRSSRFIQEKDVLRMAAEFLANPKVCTDLRRRMAQTVEQLSTAAQPPK
jgi:sentrin-specific protease 8